MSAVLKGFTLGQYLEHELKTGEKHEYYRGEIFAMVGGTPRHSLIATNFTGEARQRLGDKPCVPYNGDLRILVDPDGLYTYPDASIICGELEIDPETPNTVKNPSVLVEVLSESTEAYDRGDKAAFYRNVKFDT
jgi:Uma2 family endonuclease